MDTTADTPILLGPTIQSMLDRMERDKLLVDRMIAEERISEDEIRLATLTAKFNKAQRLIRIRTAKAQTVAHIKKAADVVRTEIQALEAKIAEAA